ncbi:Fur-regulated basic protein FbpA [Aneurinibacillus tyrosinisolvens]|uniref:Fur-regulated basic protein FbpA n=1 Tax=Aneurinibacillus tyrosinisolvens TaxID=1443435 RepID=UPI0009E61B72|nr:Fur-regulated basic protein FbpA [Aneurinibacillus tyrosinisolvens]
MVKRQKLDKYIEKLLEMGIFKIKGRQLYECSEKEIKHVLFTILTKSRKANV